MSASPTDAVRVAQGIWMPAGVAAELVPVCTAVLERLPRDSVVASVTAARLHGLWLPDLPDSIDFATATPESRGCEMTHSRRRQIRVRRLELEPDEVVVSSGLPVTSLARTWRDLAPLIGLPALVAAGDSALRLGATIDEIDEIVRRGRHVRGIRRARIAARLLDGRSRSRPESHLRVAASLSGRLRFDVNEPVHRALGGWLAEPDLSLAEVKLALEYQGEDHATLSRMRADLTRFADLRSEGWTVFAYGPAEVFGRPWDIEAEVRNVVLTRAPALLKRPALIPPR